MFKIFKKYVGLNDGVISNSPEEFLSSVEGKTFLNGMYRVFNLSEIEKWCKIVVHTFQHIKVKSRFLHMIGLAEYLQLKNYRVQYLCLNRERVRSLISR